MAPPRLCSKCHERHAAPCGKRCNRVVQGAVPDPVEPPAAQAKEDKVLAALERLQESNQAVINRVDTLEQQAAHPRTMDSRSRSRSAGRRPRRRRSPSRSRSRSRSHRQPAKSGAEVGSNPGVTVTVAWPNHRIKRGTEQVCIAFDQLTQTELSVGFCRLIADRLERESERGEEPTISTAMHAFMTRWQVDLLSFPFKSVRGYIKSVFYAMARSVLFVVVVVSR
jgi:hypothetical protein